MKHLIRLVAVSLVCVPVFAAAQTGGDIASQAQALLNQILQLQQQLGVAGGGATTSSGACATITPVKLGSSGAAVTALQQFLAADTSIYPEGKVTGYYGALTQAAVQRWQARAGIVSSGSPSTTGYGSVGPRTAAAMSAACGGGTGSNADVVGGFIKVSPVSGAAPLTVHVEATINTVKSCNAGVYTLSWGDNSATLTISIPANKCDVLSQVYTHTYSTTGNFVITLSSGEHKTTSVVSVTAPGSTTSSTGASTNTGESTGNFPTGGSSTGGNASTGGSSGSQVVSGTLAISMTPNSFSPSNVTVTSGTRVTWTNTDSMSHTVTADNASYGSGTMSPGQTYSLTFTEKGEYTYYCAFHGGPNGVGMAGKIIVQ